jgi:5-methyltetrahydropteroyltriglutamate--homocysteine methyltransferase
MKRSDKRILTTHTGSLPRPDALREMLVRLRAGEDVDNAVRNRLERAAIRESIERQLNAGIDVGNDGEQTRENFFLYMTRRLSGFGGAGWDRPQFADIEKYERHRSQREMESKLRAAVSSRDRIPEAISEVSHISTDPIVSECRTLKVMLESMTSPFAETFMTVPSPGIIARAMRNRFYDSERDYLAAIGRSLKIEYEQVVAHGFILQIDAPDLAMERHMEFKDQPTAKFLEFAEMVIETINSALVNIPSEKVRLHVCWGNYEGAHDCDIELETILPVLLKARVGAYVLPFANARHAHEFKAFRNLPLQEEQVLVAGVIDSLTNVVEHPEVIADRLEQIASVLGDPSKIIAGTDCGFDTAAGSGRVADDIVWAKLVALTEGARRASGRLF